MDALPLISPDLLSAGQLLGLLVKGFFIGLIGLAVVTELSLMPAIVRNRIARGTIISLAALPLLSWGITWHLEILPVASAADGVGAWQYSSVVVTVYCAICALLLARLARDVIATACISASAKPLGVMQDFAPKHSGASAHIRVLTSEQAETPFTWGWLRPCVILPQEAVHWSPEDTAMAMQHERMHIERGDWVMHLLARGVRALYWPVPGIGRLVDQLSLSAEQACDDRVLSGGVAAPTYAAMLLRLAGGTRVPATVALGCPSELGVRVRYMVAEVSDHSAFARGATATFVGCALLSAPIATVQLAPRPELPEPPWGRVNTEVEGVPREVQQPVFYVDDSTLSALHPAPQRPNKPPAVVRPPVIDTLHKPTIPPP